MLRGGYLLQFQRHGLGGWGEFGDPELGDSRHEDPDEGAVRLLREKVAELNSSGPHENDDFDGTLRLLLWRGSFTEINTMCHPPDRWPDAMVVYRKPDTMLLGTAVQRAAWVYTQIPTDEPRESENVKHWCARYAGAKSVVIAMLVTTEDLTYTAATTKADSLIGATAALGPAHI